MYIINFLSFFHKIFRAFWLKTATVRSDIYAALNTLNQLMSDWIKTLWIIHFGYTKSSSKVERTGMLNFCLHAVGSFIHLHHVGSGLQKFIHLRHPAALAKIKCASLFYLIRWLWRLHLTESCVWKPYMWTDSEIHICNHQT